MRKLRSSSHYFVLTATALFLLLPESLYASTGGGGGGSESAAGVLLVLAAMLIAAKIGGALAEWIGQPAVLGELVAGVVLGGSLLGIVPQTGTGAGFVSSMAEIGVILLLFEIGLETDLGEMFRVGRSSLAVAVVGVLVPFGMGYLYWQSLPAEFSDPAGAGPTATAIFIGATLTATSVGITARVLSDLRRMHTTEAKIILGAAVIDDILGLVLLSVVSGLATGAPVSVFGVGRILGVATGFLAIAIVVGRFAMPLLFDSIDRLRTQHILVVFAVAFALALAALADMAGSAMIIGAFAAGLILSETNQFDVIVDRVRPVAAIFTPIFFVAVGSSVDVSLLNPANPGSLRLLGIAGVLTLLAIGGKLVAGWAAPWRKFRRLVVGVGMVPRGEVGLIFADIGRRSGIMSEGVFGAVVLTVMATTFVAPIALKALATDAGEPPADETDPRP